MAAKENKPSRNATKSGMSSPRPRGSRALAGLDQEPINDNTKPLAKVRVVGALQKVLNKVRRGLPYSALEALQRQASLSQGQTAALLGIPERTIGRRKREGRLTPTESDRVDRTTRMLELAVKVFGEEEKARAWLQRPNRALDGETPLSLLDTDVGVRAVEDELLRIEHGTYA